MKHLRFVLLLILVAVGLSSKADRGGFYYRAFRVEAVVHPNNVWDVTELIDVTFTEPRHGIYRYIPTTFWLEHDVSEDPGRTPRVIQGKVVQDWRKFTYQSKVNSVSVEGAPFTTEDSDDEFCVIRMGDADRELIGDHSFVVHYTYTYRDDRRPSYDYLFHTVLGTDFAEPIGHFSFAVTFEKPLPADIQKRIEVYSGEYGDDNNTVEGLVVKATRDSIVGCADSVAPNHGVTLYAKLPEGYYEDTLKVDYTGHYIFFALTLLCVVVIAWLLLTVKRKKVLRVMEYWPPKDVSSAEVGTIIDGSVDIVDLSSLIPWLAGQGYLRIAELEAKSGILSKKTSLQLTKVKDLPSDAPAYQKKMMNLFFREGDTVRLGEIEQQPQAIEAIRRSLAGHFRGKRQLTKLTWPALLYLPLLIVSTAALATNSVVTTCYADGAILTLLLWTLPFCLGTSLRLAMSVRDIFTSKLNRFFVFCGKALFMALCCWLYCIFSDDYGLPMSSEIIVAFYVVGFLLGEFIGRFNVDTDYRIELANRLLGFKEFIKTADKPRLAEMQEADPQYFYKVLPYAMVFGLSKKWSKLFKDIPVENPDWYESAAPLAGYALTQRMVDSLNQSATQAIATISHDNSSHGSVSGGGFSGGGGGGGGGGSW